MAGKAISLTTVGHVGLFGMHDANQNVYLAFVADRIIVHVFKKTIIVKSMGSHITIHFDVDEVDEDDENVKDDIAIVSHS